MLQILKITLGPAATNAYLVSDTESGQSAVIDPSWDGHLILDAANQRGWRISTIWLTHAHWDHIGGAAAVADGSNPPPPVALHPEDYTLWRAGGGAALWGMDLDPGPEPTIDLAHGQNFYLGDIDFQVRFAPGHTPGHVMFYVPAEAVLFCGDVIFQGSIGRTDLPRADHATLMNSIAEQVLTLPDDTRLLPGHGPDSTVGDERQFNPFLHE